MKLIIYLPLLTSALLLGWYLSSDGEASAPAAAPAVAAQDKGSIRARHCRRRALLPG